MDSYLLHDANAGNNFKMMIMMQKEGRKDTVSTGCCWNF